MYLKEKKMKKLDQLKKVKNNYTSIEFCSMARYSSLVDENKINRDTVYFIDDSIQDTTKPLIDDGYVGKPVKNVLGVPVK